MSEPRKVIYIVTLDLPEYVQPGSMAAYIEEAISGWKGGYSPENEITNLDVGSIQVTAFEEV